MTANLRRRGDVKRLPCLVRNWLRAGVRVNGSLRRVQPLFHHKRRTDTVPRGDSRKVEADRFFEIIQPINRHDKALSTTSRDRQLIGLQGDVEIRSWFPNGQR